MKKLIIMSAISILALAGCRGGQPGAGNSAEPEDKSTVVVKDPADWKNVYREIEPTAIPGNPIELIGQGWMLITSGTPDSYNTMTASWGALGEVWSKPVSIITVRNTRYTYEFLEANDIYTLSFYAEPYRGALQILGTRSGRDTDKVAESSLTPVATPAGSMSFGEARMVLECRKLYSVPMATDSMIPDIADFYEPGTSEHHVMYIGEIIAAWVK